MTTLIEMRNFVRIVESGSISAAADSQKTVKSAVSKRLSDLEKNLGVQLISRSTRKLYLTDTGRSCYQRCIEILAEIDELTESIRGDNLELSGRLKVTTPMSFGLRHLQPIIIEFAKQHPALEFDLVFSDRTIDLIREGIDLAIRIGELQDSSLIARRLFPTRQVICASPAYIERFGEPQTPEELAKHQCLIFSDTREPTVWKYQANGKRTKHVEVSSALLADSGEFLLSAACADMGIIKTPTFIAHSALLDDQLIRILKNYTWVQTHAYALYPPTRHLSNRVRVFIDFIQSKFDDTPYWDAC